MALLRHGSRDVRARLQRKLNVFDVTNLVVGSIIGADIYIATGLAARLVGPFSLVVWVLAGVMAMVVAMSFAYCVMLLPRVGGPYAYVSEASIPFAGFMVGWALLLAEWFSLAVFPVAFAQYFASLVPGIDSLGVIALKGGFILFIIATNVVGVKAAGRTNDVLTLIKLVPLVLIIIGGALFIFANPGIVQANLSPFVGGDLSGFGGALVLVFWAYAGFELSTLPADEIERPERTIPKSIVTGLFVVIVFYLLTNSVVVASVDRELLTSSGTPLLEAASTIAGPLQSLASVLVIVVGVGALFSIAGADESGTLGTSRLAYAMALDGLLPRSFAKMHPRFRTPHVALIVLCASAFAVSVFGDLAGIINASVFLLAFVYLATCLSTLRLERRNPEIADRLKGRRVVPLMGVGISLALLLLVNPVQILVSLSVLALGVFVYAFFSPKEELKIAKELFLSREEMLKRAALQGRRFLAHPLHHLKLYLYRRRRIEPAIVLEARKREER